MYRGALTIAGPTAPTAADEMARLLATVATLMESGAATAPELVARLVPESDFPQLASNTTLAFPQLVYGVAQATQQAMAVKRRDEQLAQTVGATSVGGPLTTLQVEFRQLQQAMGQAIASGASSAEAVAARLEPGFGRTYRGLGSVISDIRGFLTSVAASLGNPGSLGAMYSRWTGEPAVGRYPVHPGNVGVSLGDISAIANIATAFVPLFVKDQRANNIVAAARGALSTAAAAERGDVSAAIKAGTETAQSIAQAAGADARVQAALAQAGQAGQAIAEQKLSEDHASSQRTVAVLKRNLEEARQRGDINAQSQIGMQLYRAEAQTLLDSLQLRRARGEAVTIPADLVQEAQQGPIRPWGGIYPIFVPPTGTPTAPGAAGECPPGYSRLTSAQIQAYTQAGTPVTVAESLPDGSVCAQVQGAAPACPPDMTRMTSAQIQAAVQAGSQLDVGETFPDGTACVRAALPAPVAPPLPAAPGYAPPAGLPVFPAPPAPAPAARVPSPVPGLPAARPIPGGQPIPAARPIPGPFALPGVRAVPIEDEESVCDPEAAGRCARALSRFGTYESARRLSCCRLMPSGRGVVVAEFAEASDNWPGRYTELPAADYWYTPCSVAEQLTPAGGTIRLPGVEPVAPCVPILGTEFSTVIVPQGWLIRLYDQYEFRGETITLTAGAHDLASRGWANRARSAQVRGPWTLRDGVIFDALRQREKGWATEDVAGGLQFSSVLQAIRNDPMRPVGAGRTKQMASWLSSYGPGYAQRIAVARTSAAQASRTLLENFRLLKVY